MNTGEIEIELDEEAVEPVGKNGVDEAAKFFEEERVERESIPVARELYGRVLRACGGGPDEAENRKGDSGVNREAADGMREVAMANDVDGGEPCEIDERDALEDAANAPSFHNPICNSVD
jgi:hypothetical protein